MRLAQATRQGLLDRAATRGLFRLALEKAREGVKKGQTPFGACVVKAGKVVALAHNAVWETTDSTAHAEIQALRAACKKLKTIDLSGCVIYSTCEPCPMCFSACHWAKVGRIVYGTRIEDARAIGFSELSISNREMKKRGKSPVKITKDFLRREALALFKEWSSRPGRRAY